MMLNLARGFVERGMRVDLVVLRLRGAYATTVPEGVNLVELGVDRARASLGALRSYLLRARPQALVSALGHMNLIAIVAGRLSGGRTRILVTEHLSLQSGRRESGAARLFPVLARWLYPSATAVVAVSEGVADTFSRNTGFPRERVTVVYNPVLTRELDAGLAEPGNTVAAGPYVLAVGRLTAQKNYPLLIRAFRRVLRQRPDLQLVILGEGELRSELEAMVRDIPEVQLPGFSANPYTAMRDCAAFVMSSDYEGLPTVLIEALASGASVVSTDCESGPAEILEGGRLGRLVPVGDEEALAAGIIEAVIEPLRATRDDLRAYTVQAATDGYLRALELNR